MKKLIFITVLFLLSSTAHSTIKENIINNLINTKNLNFDFEQNINGKIETGNCTIEYPKKIYCKYISSKKIMVSNGKSLVVKTRSGNYYRYAIERTPLNYILDKKYLIKNIQNLSERIIDDKFINFRIYENGNDINLFFNKEDLNIIGWQTVDIYQNLNITFLSKIKKNQILKKNIFKLPSIN